MASSKLHIYLIGDDHFAAKIAARLSASTYHIMHFPTGEAFLADPSNTAPGCIVAGLLMPDQNCLAFLAELKKCSVDFPAVFIGSSGESALAARMARTGTAKCLTRMPSAAVLAKLVQDAAGGFVSGEARMAQEAKAKISLLTARERQVLEHIVAGLPNKVVASRLSLSQRTVEFYRARLMKKLNVSGLAQLVRLAITGGVSLCLMAATGASGHDGAVVKNQPPILIITDGGTLPLDY